MDVKEVITRPSPQQKEAGFAPNSVAGFAPESMAGYPPKRWQGLVRNTHLLTDFRKSQSS